MLMVSYYIISSELKIKIVKITYFIEHMDIWNNRENKRKEEKHWSGTKLILHGLLAKKKKKKKGVILHSNPCMLHNFHKEARGNYKKAESTIKITVVIFMYD